MTIVIMSSEGERELREDEQSEFPYVITLSQAVLAHTWIAKGGRHPLVKKEPLDWLKEHASGKWFCEFIRTSPTTGYPAIRFQNKVDALMFRLTF